jgi:BTB/POZ domain
MASAPPAKKQKTDHPPKPPIVFQAPGLKPDVCLKVFDQEFHVHSVLLKLHSEFFRKFHDSPDKAAGGGDSASGFRYPWVTEVDEARDDWHLVAALSPEEEV